MPRAKQEELILMLNDKIDRILERLGDVDTRTKSIEEKLACMSDRLSTVENKLNAVETKAEYAIEQGTAVRVENGSLEVRLKNSSSICRKAKTRSMTFKADCAETLSFLKAFLRMQKEKVEAEEMSSICWFSFVSIK